MRFQGSVFTFLVLSVCLAGPLSGPWGLNLAQAATPRSVQLFSMAQSLERRGDEQTAISTLRQCLAQDPDDTVTLLHLGNLLAQQGNLNEAVRLIEKAQQVAPYDTMISFTLGGLYEQLGQYAKAKQAYQKGLGQNPDYPFGWMNLGRVEAQLNQPKTAIEHYQRFLIAYPKHYEARRTLAQLYLANRQEPEAAKLYQQLKVENPDRFSDHLDLARALNRSNEPQKALDALKTALSSQTNRADIAEEAGRAQLALNHPAAAIQSFQRAVSLNPDKPMLLLELANLQADQHQNEAAIQSYKTYLNQYPNRWEARQALASVYADTNRIPEALTELERTLREGGNAIPAKQQRVLRKQRGYLLQKSGRVNEAIGQYEALLTPANPHTPSIPPLPDQIGLQNVAVPFDAQKSDPQVLYNLALAYHQAGRLEDAVRIYQQLRVLSLAPVSSASVASDNEEDNNDAPTLNRAGLENDLTHALLSLGDKGMAQKQFAQAQGYFQQAVDIAQNSSTFAENSKPEANAAYPWFGLAQAQLAQKQLEAASNTYQTILSRFPKDSVPGRNATIALANIALQRKQPAEAIRLLKPLQPNTGRTAALPASYPNPIQPRLMPGVPTFELSPANASTIAVPGAASTVSASVPTQGEKGASQEILLPLAQAYSAAGNHTEAAAVYQEALLAEPNNAALLFNLAIEQQQLKQWSAAVNSYQRALQVNPQLSEAYYGLAISQEQERRFPEAMAAYEAYVAQPNVSYLSQAKQRLNVLRNQLGHVTSASSPVPAPALIK